MLVAGADVELEVVEDVADHRDDGLGGGAGVDHDVRIAEQAADGQFAGVEGVDQDAEVGVGIVADHLGFGFLGGVDDGAEDRGEQFAVAAVHPQVVLGQEVVLVATNGSRLYRDELLETFAVHRPHKITVSMYGASPETADALTQTRGAFKNAYRGMTAAAGVGLPIEVTLIITKHNVEELDEMRAMVRDLGLPFKEYASISPTYTGKGSTLAAQVPGLIGKSDVFQGCPAGHTSFHVDPLGFATMCKVGRDNPINLVIEGPDGLLRLPGIADAQMLRTGGCTGCKLSSTCRVCRPMARVYQEAKAPLSHYCQHGMKEGT